MIGAEGRPVLYEWMPGRVKASFYEQQPRSDGLDAECPGVGSSGHWPAPNGGCRAGNPWLDGALKDRERRGRVGCEGRSLHSVDDNPHTAPLTVGQLPEDFPHYPKAGRP